MSENNPPIKEFRAGTVVVAVWSQTVSVNGRAVPQYSIRVQKRYRDDKTGEWKTTSYYRTEELPKLALVVSRAYEFLTLRETEEAATSP
jgi:hypothetical protein